MSPVPVSKSAYLCHCLQVTEDDVLNVVARGKAQSIVDVQACTGAGQGCTACVWRIQQYLDRTSPLGRSSG